MVGTLFGYVNGALLFIALALGYIVLTIAIKEGKALKALGYIIGVSIIVASSLLIMGKIYWKAKICAKRSQRFPQQRLIIREQLPLPPIPKSLKQ